MKLARDFYLREDTVAVARDLLGKLLVVPNHSGGPISGMIVETEAYMGITDRAAHSYGGRRTARTEATYALGGHVYVFFVYGMYYQLNVVTGPIDHPHVVLRDDRVVVWGDASRSETKAQVATGLLDREGGTIDVSAPDVVTIR